MMIKSKCSRGGGIHKIRVPGRGSTQAPEAGPAVILSQTAVYALRAAMYLAEAPPDRPVRVDDIARALDVPRNYLSKILNVMAHAGMVTSTRGRLGGFRMGHAPDALALADVIAPFDHLAGASWCLLGGERCSDATPCAAHARWKGVSATVRDFLDGTTVADLTRGGDAGGRVRPLPTPL